MTTGTITWIEALERRVRRALVWDDVVEIRTEDGRERQGAVVGEVEPPDAGEGRWLPQSPPQTAGRLMTEKFVRVRPDMSAAETIVLLRRIDPEIETLNDL